MYCYYCGKENKDEQTFCKYCGKNLHLKKNIEPTVAEKAEEINGSELKDKSESDISSKILSEPDYEIISEIKHDEIPVSNEINKTAGNITPEPIISKPAKTEASKHESIKAEGNKVNKLLIAIIIVLSILLCLAGGFLFVYLKTGSINPSELFGDKEEDFDIENVATDTPKVEDVNAITEEKKEEVLADAIEDVDSDIVNDDNNKTDETNDDEQIVEDSDWQEAYSNVLKDSLAGKILKDEPVEYYYVYDIDKDDVPELIVKFGDCEAAYHGLIYTYDSGTESAVQLGDIGMSHTALYTCPDDNGIIQSDAHMDCQTINKIMIHSGSIQVEELLSEEIDFNGKNEWYTDVESVVRGALYIEDTESTDDSAILRFRDHIKEIVSKKNKDIHNYEVFTEDITWTEAYEKCRQKGGYLTRIDSEEEFNTICNLLNSKGVSGIAYIGGKREDDGYEYFWVGNDGELYDYDISYAEYIKYWLEGEPSYHDEVDGNTIDECYVAMLYKKDENKWYWNDICNDVRSLAPQYYTGKISYICEYE